MSVIHCKGITSSCIFRSLVIWRLYNANKDQFW